MEWNAPHEWVCEQNRNSAPILDVIVDYANGLNSFHNRFDSQDFSNEVKEIFEVPDGNHDAFHVYQ